MVQAVEIHGIPFMKLNAALDLIIDDMEHCRYIDKDSAAYRLPVAYLLAGTVDFAVEHVKKYLARLGERNDRAAQQYKAFASNLLQEALHD